MATEIHAKANRNYFSAKTFVVFFVEDVVKIYRVAHLLQWTAYVKLSSVQYKNHQITNQTNARDLNYLAQSKPFTFRPDPAWPA